MQNNINSVLEYIFSLKQRGYTPQQAMNMLMQQNPNFQSNAQILKNMSNGRNPQEFIVQMAKQGGISEQNIQNIRGLFGK